MNTTIHRLGIDGYQRPRKTYTDTLQVADVIKKKLDGYVEVPENEVDNLNDGDFIRYIKWDSKINKERFITGGVLLRIYPEYLLIKGKDNGTFSAQRYTYNANTSEKIFTTRFFKLLNNEEKLKIKLGDMQNKANEIIEELEQTIDKQTAEIEELKAIIRQLKAPSSAPFKKGHTPKQ
jgi:hypothetical protein